MTRQVHKYIIIITRCKLAIYKREILQTAQVRSDYAEKDGSLLNFGGAADNQRPLEFGHFPMTAERSLVFGHFLAPKA